MKWFPKRQARRALRDALQTIPTPTRVERAVWPWLHQLPDVRVESFGTIVDGVVNVHTYSDLQLSPTDTWFEHKGWGYTKAVVCKNTWPSLPEVDREVGSCGGCHAMEYRDVLDENGGDCRDCAGRD